MLMDMVVLPVKEHLLFLTLFSRFPYLISTYASQPSNIMTCPYA